MRRAIVFLFLAVSVAVISVTSCVHKPQVALTYGNFPDSVGKIILTNCTNAGCHNAASYHNAAELLLDSWEHLMQGSIYGAEVVAYNTKYSTLLYYINAYDSADVIANDPRHMETPLTQKEYTTLKNWIAAGAPDKDGNVPFASNAATRQEICVTLQGSGMVAIIDAKSKLVMRYIPVGDATNKTPHGIAVSADGRYTYVPFYNGNNIVKINLLTDSVVGSINLLAAGGTGNGNAGWSVIKMSPLDTAFIVSGFLSNCLVAVNTATMQRNPNLSIDALRGGTSFFPTPHGIESNATFDTFYAALGTSVIKYAFGPIMLYQKTITASGQPHQVQMTPDRSKYFVTCPDPLSPATNSVLVFDTHTDTLIKTILVGTIPQEMSVSPSKGYLFVTCMEDAANPLPKAHGSVYVIDYNTLEVVKIIYGDFYQPHSMAVDEQNGLIFIPSRNASPSGPAPHHTLPGNGRPGWYSVYNLNTLEPADNKRYFVPADPYAAAARFK